MLNFPPAVRIWLALAPAVGAIAGAGKKGWRQKKKESPGPCPGLSAPTPR